MRAGHHASKKRCADQDAPPGKRAKKTSDEAAAGQLGKQKPFSLDRVPLVERQLTFRVDQVAEAAAHFKKHGYVVVTDVLSEPDRVEFIKQLVKDVLQRQPWSLAAPFKICDPVTGEELDIDRDTDRYIAAFTRPMLSKEMVEMLYASEPFHAGFGAPCDGAGFHLPTMWKIRQDPRLYNLFRALMGGKAEMFVDINRPIVKYPGKGDHAFLHWDMNVLQFDEDDDFLEGSISGKVAATDMTFMAAPGSHTKDAHRHISKHYRPLYPGIRPNSAKFGLDPTKADPLGLFERARVIHVPKGAAVFWSTRLLHGVRKLSMEAGVQLGFYLGAMPAENRPAYKKKAGISEVKDRVRSWRECRAPKLFPSLDEIYYYPNRYTNFPLRMLPKYVAKTNPGWPGLTTRRIQSGPNAGTVYTTFVPVPNPNPAPPPLTELGKKLLGLVKWAK